MSRPVLARSLAAPVLAAWLGLVFGLVSGQALAGPAGQAVDLGDSHARVQARLGEPLRGWGVAMCPAQRIELRRQGKLWLKLVYDRHDRLRAAGIFRLAQGGGKGGGAQSAAALRWTGLVPGLDGRSVYPEPAGWRPFFWTTGAKQWLWIEMSEQPYGTQARERFLGGVVVDEASGFAGGTDFPYDVAEAVTAAGLSGSDLAEAGFTRPLLAWRSRTQPNAYVEALPDSPDQVPGCSAVMLALPDYTDFLPASR